MMSRDYALNGAGAGDGLLTRQELQQYIEMLRVERIDAVDMREPTDVIDLRLEDSRRLLRDMDLVQADAVSYLPDALRDLPERLRRRATEILMLDDPYGLGEIDRGMLESARTRYRDLYGPSLAFLNSKTQALEEIDALEAALDL